MTPNVDGDGKLYGSPWHPIRVIPMFQSPLHRPRIVYEVYLSTCKNLSFSAYLVLDLTNGETNISFSTSAFENLHIQRAKVPLFNCLFSKSKGEKLILWIEDVGLESSTMNPRKQCNMICLGPILIGMKVLVLVENMVLTDNLNEIPTTTRRGVAH